MVCRVGIVHQFDDEVYFGVEEYVVGIVGERGIYLPFLVDIAYAYPFYFHVVGSDTLQYVVQSVADCSETEKSDVQFFTVHVCGCCSEI